MVTKNVSMSSNTSLFSADFKAQPYWWDDSQPAQFEQAELPGQVDVLVIGSGYTGLNTAIQTARAGRHTLVVDAEQAGWGCSTRNGGQISTSVKAGYQELAAKYGADKARAILTEAKQSLEWIGNFVEQENLDCDFNRVGRFHAAHNPAQFRKLSTAIKSQLPGLENGAYLVSQQEQREELGSDAYYGGVVFPQHCSLHPGKYHGALMDLALKAGASLRTQCKVVAIEQQKNGFVVTTTKGRINAAKVVIATNGYTGSLTPWQQRRVIPIGSYVIATEQLAPGLIEQLMPKNRIVSDSRKVVFYYRSTPDRQRIIFGGRVSHNETDPTVSGPLLHKNLAAIFPQLAEVKINYSWMGFVAYTFDTLMHVGNRDGLHYAMGYCGSGVGMASYLGMRMGQQVIGVADGSTAFDDLPFPTRPLYTGNPWFLAPSVAYYRLRDRLNI